MRRGCGAFSVLLLFFTVLPVSGTIVWGEEYTRTKVYGKISAADTGLPLSGARVAFWKDGKVVEAETDETGRYEVQVLGNETYKVYACYDQPSTPGFDYVPAYRDVAIGPETVNVSFSLLPGASIRVAVDFRPFDNMPPVEKAVFSVLDEQGLLNESEAVTAYGETLLVNEFLDIDNRTVVVPSGMPIMVEVDVYYVDGLSSGFAIDEGAEYVRLTQGSQLIVNATRFMLWGELYGSTIGRVGYWSQRRWLITGEMFWTSGYRYDRLIYVEDMLKPAITPLERSAGEAFDDGDYEGAYANLSRAYEIIVNLEKIILDKADTANLKNPVEYSFVISSRIRSKIEEAEELGFYLAYEKNRLANADRLLEEASLGLSGDDRDRVLADLFEANLILRDLESALEDMYTNASQSVVFVTPFLGFTAIITASFLFDSRRKRLAGIPALYFVLLALLYLVHPGYNIYMYSSLTNSIMLVAFSLLVPLFIIHGLLYLFGGRPSKYGICLVSAVAAAFSLSAGNLRRRKFRTVLTSVLMFISVFALIALTSYSQEEGFHVQPHSGQAPSRGFLLRMDRSRTSIMWAFRAVYPEEGAQLRPVPETLVEWLEERNETTLVVPLWTNFPRGGIEPPRVRTLRTSSGLNYTVLGIMGVLPSLEIAITHIDRAVVQGRFLGDNDVDGILISEEAAEELQVGANDTLELSGVGRPFKVTGIFSGRKLDELADLDGTPLHVLFRVFNPDDPDPYWTRRFYKRVPSRGVVIVHGEAAKNLLYGIFSRVNVQTGDPEQVMDLARLSVLLWSGTEAFASAAGVIDYLFIGEYVIAVGFEATLVLFLLMALNIGTNFLGGVYERRREVFSMASVGLNPTHVTAVFFAEAMIIGSMTGSIGYILGVSSYRFMPLLFPILVKQKLSAFWCILALIFSIAAAVLGSTIPALKASMIATPSLLRRWKLKTKTRKGENWVHDLPIRVKEEDLDEFFNFIRKRMRESAGHKEEWVTDLEIVEPTVPVISRLRFTYIYGENRMTTRNELYPVKRGDQGEYSFQLKTISARPTRFEDHCVWKTADFVRRLILQYDYKKSTMIEKIPSSEAKISGI